MSLAGVALGAIGSFFGQHLVLRASARQLEVEQSAAHRAELKDVILKFLGVASRVQKAALARSGDDGGRDGDGGQDGRLDELVEELWLAQAEIDLAARTEPMRGATYRYAFRLAETARGDDADAATLRGVQVEFMDAAYDDLWPGRQLVTASSDLGRNA
ncbi:hypothetical protein GCM10009647_054290 [Streptomyces sanglieri]|uniref:Secreted protein n=1 Tax=Streptomyces sanglieri TaxID=193460 RepID=A0ABW2XC95_9ACTN|nr:hypothetical protein [Streptomyces sp. Wh19]MDV9194699.1 hypothetical protein [Streptomyces sp. Wh19]